MLSVPTVFVIGAGAGTEIGMPTGSELSDAIAHKLDIRFEEFGSKQRSGDPQIADALKRICKEKGEDFNGWRAAACTVATGIHYTRSIDSYLHTHKDNERVKVAGKLAIVQTILEYEKGSAALRLRNNWQDSGRLMGSWMQDFMYVLQDGIVAAENLNDLFRNLCIINFNYDRCIEQFFYFAIQDLYQVPPAKAAELMGSLRIFHPYGVVGYLDWETKKRRVDFGVTDYGDFTGLATEIRTFNEQIEEGNELEAMREAVASAERVVFLGFHFHKQNMALITTGGTGRGGSVKVFGTVMNRSGSDVAIIQDQIRRVLAARGGTWEIDLKGVDCKGLFKEFGTALLS
jgi:hypothetical protein